MQTSFLCMSRVLPVCPWIGAAGRGGGGIGIQRVVTFPLKSDESSEWLHQPHLEFSFTHAAVQGMQVLFLR